MTAVQQSAAPHPAVRQRIDWIDTAKGLCMILVIVGHTLPYGNLMRNFIFSFHMPAFFFLSGMTFRPEKYKTCLDYIKKRGRTLILPYFAVTNCDRKHFPFHICGTKNPPQNPYNHFYNTMKMDYSYPTTKSL